MYVDVNYIGGHEAQIAAASDTHEPRYMYMREREKGLLLNGLGLGHRRGYRIFLSLSVSPFPSRAGIFKVDDKSRGRGGIGRRGTAFQLLGCVREAWCRKRGEDRVRECDGVIATCSSTAKSTGEPANRTGRNARKGRGKRIR